MQQLLGFFPQNLIYLHISVALKMEVWIVYLHEAFFEARNVTDDIYARRNKKPYIYVKARNTVVNILMQCDVGFILDNRAESTFAKLGYIC